MNRYEIALGKTFPKTRLLGNTETIPLKESEVEFTMNSFREAIRNLYPLPAPIEQMDMHRRLFERKQSQSGIERMQSQSGIENIRREIDYKRLKREQEFQRTNINPLTSWETGLGYV